MKDLGVPVATYFPPDCFSSPMYSNLSSGCGRGWLVSVVESALAAAEAGDGPRDVVETVVPVELAGKVILSSSSLDCEWGSGVGSSCLVSIVEHPLAAIEGENGFVILEILQVSSRIIA